MGGLGDTLTGHTTIGLDTNPFIYLFEQHPRYFPLIEELFAHLKLPSVQGVTSIVTLIETCVQPERDGRGDLVRMYEQTLLNSQQVQMVNIDVALAKRAIQLRALYGFRVPDALQLSAALEHGATLFVTNDHRFRKTRELSVLILDDFAS